MLFVVASCSNYSKKTVKTGTFSFECPDKIVLEEMTVNYHESYEELHYLVNKGNVKYDRTYLFGQDDNEVFEMTLYLINKEEKTINDLCEELRSSLNKEGFWTIYKEIENKSDNISFKVSLNRKEIQDYGVQYYRFFEKADKFALVKITIREDADSQYEEVIRSLLKSVR